jgi:hypothetical protein
MIQRPVWGSILVTLLAITSIMKAQSSSPAPAASEPPVAYASVTQLNHLLEQLQQFSDSSQSDLTKLRIERWKTDSTTKHQTQTNVDSLTRNLHDALPEMISALRNSPENLAATFKVYRNLDALYDVFGSVVESAGAFGSKDEFQSLDNDLNVLEQSRRAFAERMAGLATQKEDELSSLRTKIQQAQAVPAAVTPVKKVVVDDTTPSKKPVKKKVPKPQPATPTTPAAPPAAQPAKPN